jgi:GT2 family glycosyltransferase
MNDTVAAVVVTYNRKQLLTECLDALLAQTQPVDKIILIDNASSDGTPEMLKESGYLDNKLIDYVRLPENTGGAGGFHTGIKRGHSDGYAWLWVMDDDTIPERDSLEELINATHRLSKTVDIGFVASRVVWTNGDVHLMNIPSISSLSGGKPFNLLDDHNAQIIDSCSFVSSLVSCKAVSVCGLPLAEMFIWGDDVEFYSRITKSSFVGIYYPKSQVTHKTASNYNTNFTKDNKNNLWKYRFGIRNELYIKKNKYGKLIFIFFIVHGLTIKNLNILRYRKDSRFMAILINVRAILSSITFNPKIGN